MTIEAGIRPELPDGVHSELKWLIECGWEVKPDQRPTIGAICERMSGVGWQVFDGVDAARVQSFIRPPKTEWRPDAMRIAFVCAPSLLANGETLAAAARELETGMIIDVVVRELSDELDVHAAVAVGLPVGSIPMIAVPFRGEVDESVAAACSLVCGSTEFKFDPKEKTLTITQSTTTGFLLWGSPAMSAERLVIGPRCQELGGFFAPLLKKVKVLDLRQAPADVRIHRRSFAVMELREVLTPGTGSAETFCNGFRNAFGAVAVTASWCQVKALRGSVPLEDFAWCDFPNLVDVSGTDWATLPAVPVDIKSCALPSRLEHVPDHAFANRARLISVDFGARLSEIGAGAFRGCVALRSAALPRSLLRIGNAAFAGCSALRELTFPGVVEIGVDAFVGCDALGGLLQMWPAGMVEPMLGSFVDGRLCPARTGVDVTDEVTSDTARPRRGGASDSGGLPAQPDEWLVKPDVPQQRPPTAAPGRCRADLPTQGVKVAVCGDPRVGKSSLISVLFPAGPSGIRACNGRAVEVVEVGSLDQVRAVQMPADVVVIAFGLDNVPSFQGIGEWARETRAVLPRSPSLVVGLRLDAVRRVESPEVAELDGAAGYAECSSVSGEGVLELGEALLRVAGGECPGMVPRAPKKPMTLFHFAIEGAPDRIIIEPSATFADALCEVIAVSGRANLQGFSISNPGGEDLPVDPAQVVGRSSDIIYNVEFESCVEDLRFASIPDAGCAVYVGDAKKDLGRLCDFDVVARNTPTLPSEDLLQLLGDTIHGIMTLYDREEKLCDPRGGEVIAHLFHEACQRDPRADFAARATRDAAVQVYTSETISEINVEFFHRALNGRLRESCSGDFVPGLAECEARLGRLFPLSVVLCDALTLMLPVKPEETIYRGEVLKSVRVLYRGLRLDRGAIYHYAELQGKVVSLCGFTSFSLDKKVADEFADRGCGPRVPVRIELLSRDRRLVGTPALEPEQEVILPPFSLVKLQGVLREEPDGRIVLLMRDLALAKSAPVPRLSASFTGASGFLLYGGDLKEDLAELQLLDRQLRAHGRMAADDIIALIEPACDGLRVWAESTGLIREADAIASEIRAAAAGQAGDSPPGTRSKFLAVRAAFDALLRMWTGEDVHHLREGVERALRGWTELKRATIRDIDDALSEMSGDLWPFLRLFRAALLQLSPPSDDDPVIWCRTVMSRRTLAAVQAGTGRALLMTSSGSFSIDRETAQALGRSAPGADEVSVLLTLRSKDRAKIGDFSAFPREDEVLLPPVSLVVVDEVRAGAGDTPFEVIMRDVCLVEADARVQRAVDAKLDVGGQSFQVLSDSGGVFGAGFAARWLQNVRVPDEGFFTLVARVATALETEVVTDLGNGTPMNVVMSDILKAALATCSVDEVAGKVIHLYTMATTLYTEMNGRMRIAGELSVNRAMQAIMRGGETPGALAEVLSYPLASFVNAAAASGVLGAFALALDQALLHPPKLCEAMTVYRGINVAGATKQIVDLYAAQIGRAAIRWPSFTSTSRSAAASLAFNPTIMFEIETKDRPEVSAVSFFGTEEEILFPSGSFMVVRGVREDRGLWWISLVDAKTLPELCAPVSMSEWLTFANIAKSYESAFVEDEAIGSALRDWFAGRSLGDWRAAFGTLKRWMGGIDAEAAIEGIVGMMERTTISRAAPR